MGSKGKIIDAFTQAYERISEISLPDGANGCLRQMQRAFTELRQHDSGQAKIVRSRLKRALSTRKGPNVRAETKVKHHL